MKSKKNQKNKINNIKSIKNTPPKIKLKKLRKTKLSQKKLRNRSKIQQGGIFIFNGNFLNTPPDNSVYLGKFIKEGHKQTTTTNAMGKIFRGPTGHRRERHFFYNHDQKNTSYPHTIFYSESIPKNMEIGKKLEVDNKNITIKGWINFPEIDFRYKKKDNTGKFYLNNSEVLTLIFNHEYYYLEFKENLGKAAAPPPPAAAAAPAAAPEPVPAPATPAPPPPAAVADAAALAAAALPAAAPEAASATPAPMQEFYTLLIKYLRMVEGGQNITTKKEADEVLERLNIGEFGKFYTQYAIYDDEQGDVNTPSRPAVLPIGSREITTFIEKDKNFFDKAIPKLREIINNNSSGVLLD